MCLVPPPPPALVLTFLSPQDDDEWDDYRENKKDYTGLKIENLVVEEPVKQEEEETEVKTCLTIFTNNGDNALRLAVQINEDGEVVKVKKGEDGPWNKKEGERQNSQDETPEPEPRQVAPTIVEQANVQGGQYVPPHMRGAGGGETPEREQRRPMQRRWDRLHSLVWWLEKFLMAVSGQTDYLQNHGVAVLSGVLVIQVLTSLT